jgi:hypothetical protein
MSADWATMECFACRVTSGIGKKRTLMGLGLAISVAVMVGQGADMKNACKAVPDEVMCVKVMNGIAQVESGGRDIATHSDGVSHGRYGVTQVAVDELVRVHVLDHGALDLDDPTVNAMVARLYLLLMFKRCSGAWWNAVEMYHGNRDTSANRAYAVKVWAAMQWAK